MVLLACAWNAGCARAPAPAPVTDAGDVVWGDEYEGVLVDTDLRDADFHASRLSFAADVLAADTRVVRAKGSAGPLGGRYRESDAGRAGALEWNSARIAAVAGAVRASLGEGAVIADAREAAGVEPRGTRSLDGLRLSASSSIWGSALGAGARAALGWFRFGAGAWRGWESDADARAFLSLGVAHRRTVVFAAAGRSRAGPGAFSLSAGHARAGVFTAGELGLAPGGARGVARIVAGEDGGWRVLIAAGVPSAAGDPTPASAGMRWGGAVERRGKMGRVDARAVLSSRTRRDGPLVERRQRAEWRGSLGAGDARVEAGLRATREATASASDLLDAATPAATRDDLRVRWAVRTTESIGEALRVEQAYRVDLIVSGAGPAGRVVAWTGRARWRAVDARLQASAFDLGPGQLAYAGRAVLPGAATFTTLSNSGVDLSASLRVQIGCGAAAGVQGVRTAAGEPRFVLQAGVAF